MEYNLLPEITSLYKTNQWQEMLKLSENGKSEDLRNFMWVWPSQRNLRFIAKKILDNHLDGIMSIGCGCGLFEWILQESTSVPVLGYEVNQEWWESKYSNPHFIPLQYPEQPPKDTILKKNYALLFCYFNNRSAFIDYVNAYKGNMIFIIGPDICKDVHTDPEPFQPKFPNPLNWKLQDFQEIRETKDFIAVYTKS